MIKARNRMWEAPVDFTKVTGALVCRLPGNVFAYYRDGKWNQLSYRDWQKKFENLDMLQCDMGGWVITDKLVYTHGRGGYCEPISEATLNMALKKAEHQLLALSSPAMMPVVRDVVIERFA